MSEERSLKDFAAWWLRERKFKLPKDCIRHVGGIAGVTLYRDGPFQVQLFIGGPNASSTKHSHPNVEAVEIFMGGEIDFETDHREFKNGLLYIAAGEPHTAVIGQSGGCLISIQKWINGEPTSVELDWDGAPMDEKHAEAL